MKPCLVVLTLILCFVGGQYWESHKSHSEVKALLAFNETILQQAEIRVYFSAGTPKAVDHKSLLKHATISAKRLVDRLKKGYTSSDKSDYVYANAYKKKNYYEEPSLELKRKIESLPKLLKHPQSEMLMQVLEMKLAKRFRKEIPAVAMARLEHDARSILKKVERIFSEQEGYFLYSYSIDNFDDIGELRYINKIIPELFSKKPWTEEAKTSLTRISKKYSNWRHKELYDLFTQAKAYNKEMMTLNGLPKQLETDYRETVRHHLEHIVDCVVERTAKQLWANAKRSKKAGKVLSTDNLKRLADDLFSGKPSAIELQELNEQFGTQSLAFAFKGSLSEFGKLSPIEYQRIAFSLALDKEVSFYVQSIHRENAKKYVEALWDEHPEILTREKLPVLVLNITSEQSETAGASKTNAHTNAKADYQKLLSLRSQTQHHKFFPIAFDEAITRRIGLELKSVSETYASEILEPLLKDEISIDGAVDKLFDFKSKPVVKKSKSILQGLFSQTVAVSVIEKPTTSSETNPRLKARLKFCARMIDKSQLKTEFKPHLLESLKPSFIRYVSQMVDGDVDTVLKTVFNRKKVHKFACGELRIKISRVADELVKAVSNNCNRTEAIVQIWTGSMSKSVKIDDLLGKYSKAIALARKLTKNNEDASKLVNTGLYQNTKKGTKSRLTSGHG